jgi:hypothetical protein
VILGGRKAAQFVGGMRCRGAGGGRRWRRRSVLGSGDEERPERRRLPAEARPSGGQKGLDFIIRETRSGRARANATRKPRGSDGAALTAPGTRATRHTRNCSLRGAADGRTYVLKQVAQAQCTLPRDLTPSHLPSRAETLFFFNLSLIKRNFYSCQNHSRRFY